MGSGQRASTKSGRIAGLVCCLPPSLIDNSRFEQRFGDKATEVTKMTGVKTRYWADEEVTTSDLCQRAAEHLLEKLQWPLETVDALIFISQTPDYRLPATACSLQTRLGMRPGTIAFDVSLGCSAYPYGLWLAMMMIDTSAVRRVLLAVGDTISHIVDEDDRSTAMLFGDAGAVTAIERVEDGSQATFILGSDGSGAENLIVPKGAFRNDCQNPKLGDRPLDKLFMDGGEIFNFTLKAVPALIRDTIAADGRPIEEYDFFLLHQANAFMIRHLAKKAKLPPEKVPINIDRYGNTSSATLPLLMATDCAHELASAEQQIAMFGFGVGYSWAAASLRVGPLGCVETIKL